MDRTVIDHRNDLPAQRQITFRLGSGIWSADICRESDTNDNYQVDLYHTDHGRAAGVLPFTANDTIALAHLVQLLAVEFVNDGWIDDQLRAELHRLATALENAIAKEADPC